MACILQSLASQEREMDMPAVEELSNNQTHISLLVQLLSCHFTPNPLHALVFLFSTIYLANVDLPHSMPLPFIEEQMRL